MGPVSKTEEGDKVLNLLRGVTCRTKDGRDRRRFLRFTMVDLHVFSLEGTSLETGSLSFSTLPRPVYLRERKEEYLTTLYASEERWVEFFQNVRHT